TAEQVQYAARRGRKPAAFLGATFQRRDPRDFGGNVCAGSGPRPGGGGGAAGDRGVKMSLFSGFVEVGERLGGGVGGGRGGGREGAGFTERRGPSAIGGTGHHDANRRVGPVRKDCVAAQEIRE